MLKRSSRPRNFFRNLVVNGVNNSKTAIQNDCLMRLYDADSELKAVSSELDSFDGKKDPVRCNLLVNQLRTAQDKVISLLFQLMDDCNCERASRDYRMKFPDEILLSEGSESLNGQIWFGAECLSAGSNILNHNKESTMLRPMAKTLTQHLDSLRNDLRDLVIDGGGAVRINDALIKKMVAFDHTFATFEYEYVRTMLPIRTVAEIEKLQEVAVLFSETLIDCLKRGLIKQDDIDEFQPIVMIAIPRLAIVRGLLYKNENPIYTRHKSQMCSLFQPFHGPLHSIRKLLRGLRSHELYTLERMLANDQTNNSENEQHPCRQQSNDDDAKNTVVNVESSSSNDGKSPQQVRETESTVQAGTSNSNSANVLMDGLQYPVGHKRVSVDEEVEQSEGDLNCYLEVQASSSKSNVDACGSPVDVAVPSPSTSLSTPPNRKALDNACSNNSQCKTRNSGRRLREDDGFSRNKTECDTDDCCLSPPESDGQLEKLIANFNPSMNDEAESQVADAQAYQNSSSTHGSTAALSGREDRNRPSEARSSKSSDMKKVRGENEAEIEELFQRQAQQLLHRLFVAISGVADQLQSNFASDLRFILRHIFSSEIAGDESDGDADNDVQDELDNAIDEAYGDDEDEVEGEYSNEHSDSSLPIEQGIEARETNLIDFESGYTLMDSIERAGLYAPDNTTATIPANQDYPFNNSNTVEQHYLPPPPPPVLTPALLQHSVDMNSSAVSVGSVSSQQNTNMHYNQTDEHQRVLQNTLNQRQMNHELLADLMRTSGHNNHQNLGYNPSSVGQESPNEPSIMDNNQHHQRLMQQHLQSVSRATNRIAAAAAAASAATVPGYGHSIGDSNTNVSNYPHQVSSSHHRSMANGSERRSRHHGGSRSRRVRGPPVWVPDQDVIQCSCCTAPFTLFRRRHHCRACGQIFCADCSKFTKNLNCWGYNGPVRVCESCYNQP